MVTRFIGKAERPCVSSIRSSSCPSKVHCPRPRVAQVDSVAVVDLPRIEVASRGDARDQVPDPHRDDGCAVLGEYHAEIFKGQWFPVTGCRGRGAPRSFSPGCGDGITVTHHAVAAPRQFVQCERRGRGSESDPCTGGGMLGFRALAELGVMVI